VRRYLPGIRPLVTLSGEADITTAARLSELVTAQLSGETRYLSIDAAELTYADSMAIHVLLMAAETLKERGGSHGAAPAATLRRQDAGADRRDRADHYPGRNRVRAQAVSPATRADSLASATVVPRAGLFVSGIAFSFLGWQFCSRLS
jgi:ABC-type transporter Mla MlaB component